MPTSLKVYIGLVVFVLWFMALVAAIFADPAQDAPRGPGIVVVRMDNNMEPYITVEQVDAPLGQCVSSDPRSG